MVEKNKLILQKNQKYIVKIVDLGSNGEGIAKIDGFTVFVPFALIGEEVEILIVLVKKDFAIGKILNIIKHDSSRVEAPCPYFTKCGGCQLQHINYADQLTYKQNFVQNCLKKYANISTEKVLPCVDSNREYYYRNKFSFPIGLENGRVVVGMYRTASHKLVPIKKCMIQEIGEDIIAAFEDYANKFNIKVYDEESKTGVKHLVCRNFNDRILLSIVCTEKLQNLQYLYDLLTKNHKFVNILVNINKKHNNVILGDKDYLFAGADYLDIEEYGIKYQINNHSFMQVNNEVKHKLYDMVLQNISKDDIVVDAYSGAGVLSAIMAQKCKQVYGIEIVKPAVDSAQKLAKENNIQNLKSICGDCAVELPKMIAKLKDFVVVLDPPRKGCDAKVIDALNQSKPQKIIYVSCNPATLARDLNLLKENYELISATPFDMFPQTANVETVAILNLK